MTISLLTLIGIGVLHGAWIFGALSAAVGLCALAVREPDRRYAFAHSGLLLGAAAVVLVPLSAAAVSLFGSDGMVATLAPLAGPLTLDAAGTWGQRLLPVVGGAWLAGVAVLVARGRLDNRRMRGWLASMSPVRESWRHEADAAARAAGLAGAPPALESSAVTTPMLLGLRRPTLIMPTAGFSSIGAAGRHALLLHEFAHVRLSHPRRRARERVAETVLFFHPLLPVVRGFLERERELSCDRDAAERCHDARIYVRALAALEIARSPLPSQSVALHGAALLPRLRWLSSDRSRNRRDGMTARLAAGAAFCTATAGIALGAVALPAADAHSAVAALAGPDRYLIQAADPAGSFTIDIARGRAVDVRLDGRPLAASDIVQSGPIVQLHPRGDQSFQLRIRPRGGITWNARTR